MTTNQTNHKMFSVENLKRDPKFLSKVYNTKDGCAPPAPKDGEKVKHVESCELHLGSKDDEGAKDIEDDEGNKTPVLQPRQLVPEWAVDKYKQRFGVFKHWISTRDIVIHAV